MKVKPFRFDQAQLLPVSQQRSLLAWLQAGCALAARKWQRLFPFAVEVLPGETESLGRKEALARLPANGLAYCIAVGESALNSMLTLPRALAIMLSNGLLGDTPQRLPPDRPLALSEETLCEYLLEQCVLPALQESWPGDKGQPIELRHKEPEPQFTRLLPASDPLVLVPLVFRGPFGETACSWLVPRKPLMALLGLSDKAPGSENAHDTRQRLQAHVATMPVVLNVALGRAELGLSQLGRLQVGDVVVLNQRTTDTLTASVAGRQKFRVWCGRIGSRQALQIDSLIES